MNNFYHQFITDKSFLILKQLKKDFDFVLIKLSKKYFW